MKIISEFKEFALRGSVVDLAVGVIIGSSFGAIVTSLTNDVVMPPIGWMIGGIDFSELKIAMPQNMLSASTDVVYISYGKFIQTIINFLIIAFSIFFAIKFINRLKRVGGTGSNKTPEAGAVEATTPTTPEVKPEEELLKEIRDILKSQNKA